MKKYRIIAAVCSGLLLVTSGCVSGNNGTIPAETVSVVQKKAASEEMLSGEMSVEETSVEETVAESNKTLKFPEEPDIVSELERIEEQAAKLEQQYLHANSQFDMTEASGDIYKLWDNELNDLWGRLKSTLNEEELSVLIEEENKWIASRDADVKENAAEYEGGSMYSMVVTSRAAVLTRKRVYELADRFSAKTDRMYEDLGSGIYVKCQVADRIPDSLYLNYLGAGTYDVEIRFNELGELKGIAKDEGDAFSFEDKELQVKGTIACRDTGAVLTVIESEWEEMAVGAVFEFLEKYEYPEQFSFSDISKLEFWFGSGAGAWRTVLYVHEDGTFEGEYLDTNMGSKEQYLCDFSGKFTEPVKVNDYTWSVKTTELHFVREPGTTEVRDGWTYHYEEPYGLNDAEELLFYLPGAPVSELPGKFMEWARGNGSALLPFYGLYNVNGRQGFSSHIKTD